MSAGSIITSGGLERAIDAYRRAGSGSRGLTAARDFLNRSYAGESSRSIRTVLREVEDSVSNANRINRLNPGTVLGRDRFGSAADLERGAVGRGRTAGQVRVRMSWHNADGTAVFTTTSVFEADWRMTRQELMLQVLDQAAARGLEVVDSPRSRQHDRDAFDRPPTITIEAAFTRLHT